MTLQNAVNRVPFANTLITVFSSSGNFVANAATQAAIVECWGGGGGSSGIQATGAGQVGVAGSGASGSYTRRAYTRSELAGTIAVTVGAGGSAGIQDAPGGSGGTTQFLGMSAQGGNGSFAPSVGNQAFTNFAASPGSATGGQVNIPGVAGWRQWGAFVGGEECVVSTPDVPGAFGTGIANGASGPVSGQNAPARNGLQAGPGRIIVTEFLRP